MGKGDIYLSESAAQESDYLGSKYVKLLKERSDIRFQIILFFNCLFPPMATIGYIVISFKGSKNKSLKGGEAGEYHQLIQVAQGSSLLHRQF